MQAIHYTLSFPNPASRQVSVEATLPVEAGAPLELFMANWTPGSLKIEDYARNVEGLRASAADGLRLEVVKCAKNRWRLDARGADQARLSYRLYCGRLSATANFVAPSFALLNGAATFLGIVGDRGRPAHVTVLGADHWARSVATLPAGQDASTFVAPDYESLADCTIYAGDPSIRRFQVRGVEHVLVNEGGEGAWDFERAAQDVARIVEEEATLWGEIPYPSYTLLNLIVDGFGGLEHATGAVAMTRRATMGERPAYVAWLGQVAHELFHAWNGKLLRPVELFDPDYEREACTRSLWVTEGMTSYYEPLLVHRAGLSTRDELLGRLSATIRGLQATPGRKVQTLEAASFDAWIKFHRPDENTANSSVSFYRKGALVAWLLDVALRRETDGQTTLDDLLRAALAGFADRGFESGDVERLAVELAGGSEAVAALLEGALRSTAELDYAPALDWLGLELGRRPAGREVAWLGARTRIRDGRLYASGVPPGTPAFDAGLRLDDEIVALDDRRVQVGGLHRLLRSRRPGSRVDLLVARRRRMVTLTATLGRRPATAWTLTVAESPTPEQSRNLERWLSGR